MSKRNVWARELDKHERTRIYASSIAKNSKRPENASVTPNLHQRHSTAHGGARKAQEHNGCFRHALMHTDHREQLEYTCKCINSVGNAELPARGEEPRVSEPKRLKNESDALNACKALRRAHERLKPIRTCQKTLKLLHKVRLTWYKPRTAPRGVTEAQEPRRCTQRLRRCEIDCKITLSH